MPQDFGHDGRAGKLWKDATPTIEQAKMVAARVEMGLMDLVPHGGNALRILDPITIASLSPDTASFS
ncbi:hypothetical protein ASG50_28105 [Rhizobium sp. Leaf386]|nr:hypothetical protein ASG50_28105 [Rhizobium sp. Leaf386]